MGSGLSDTAVAGIVLGVVLLLILTIILIIVFIKHKNKKTSQTTDQVEIIYNEDKAAEDDHKQIEQNAIELPVRSDQKVVTQNLAAKKTTPLGALSPNKFPRVNSNRMSLPKIVIHKK